MIRTLLLTGLVLIQTSDIEATAFCALRDPVYAIQQLYPDASDHRSVVKRIGDTEKQSVARRFPFTIHRKELGDHTVYVAIEKGSAVGVVHVRSEQSKWGLVEVAWALTPDLQRVEDFRFQRCRDPSGKAAEAEAFRSQLKGKSIEELVALLSEDGTEVKEGALPIQENAERMASALVRSAIKTLAISQDLYAEQVKAVVEEVAERE